MRTTVDLPDDLHDLARHLAHEGNWSMSEVIAELIRLGLRHGAPEVASGSRGLPVVAIGRPITAQDVRSLDDNEWACGWPARDAVTVPESFWAQP